MYYLCIVIHKQNNIAMITFTILLATLRLLCPQTTPSVYHPIPAIARQRVF